MVGAMMAIALSLPPPAAAKDVDGPNDCMRTTQDFGDAPEGIPAYSIIAMASFPTCLSPGPVGTQESQCPPISTPPGPAGFVRHLGSLDGYWLGCPVGPLPPMGIDSEPDGKVSIGALGSACADIRVDCFEPAFGINFGQDDCVGGDDAGVAPPVLRACMTATVTFNTYNCASPREAFLNILVDMNQDGDWNDNFACPGGVACAYEWAVKNVRITVPSGCGAGTSPAFRLGPHAGESWMRVTLSDEAVPDDFPWNGSAGTDTEALHNGETEDYPVLIEQGSPDPCQSGYLEFGDAPEDLAAYPSGAVGHFPTCTFPSPAGTQELSCAPISSPPGPTGFVRHAAIAGDPAHFWLGCPTAVGQSGVDGEADGKVNFMPMPPAPSHCNSSVGTDCFQPAFGVSYGQDECYGDDDAGITSAIEFVACSTATVSFSAFSCSDLNVYLNILVDWNEDGDWNDNFACLAGVPCAYEWAVKNVPIALQRGCQALTSPQFQAGPRAGRGWLRITLTQEPVCDNFPWNGSACMPGEEFRNGETEDYPITVREPVFDPCQAEYLDFGDAPEALACYPSGTPGKFPTCGFPGPIGTMELACPPISTPPGPAGFMKHVAVAGDPVHFWLGSPSMINAYPGVDAEKDGKVNFMPMPGDPSFCNSAVPTDCWEPAFGSMFGQDECYGDLDAGIATPMEFAACSIGTVTFQAFSCSDLDVYLNILVDWNQDGDWNDNFACLSGAACAYEWAVKNVPITLRRGTRTLTSPQFTVGPRPGLGWLRITLTQEPACDNFPWNGSACMPGEQYRNGETEDYPVVILPSLTGVSDRQPPSELRLAVVPNPSRDGATINCALPRESEGSLSVYDIAGRKLRELAHGTLPAGEHSLRWDFRTDEGGVAPVGLYLLKLHAGDQTLTRTLIRIQ
ncbi:MAG: hypothetical protein A2V63_07435 [Candidatus Eisenbacteria bacterium RBG_19FT_COMBO_70_11]|nr:MAG: hypothetical protein A2V63_07435 [Candidatus Eisenbacteria bacterium RBG_19FT_COMBO_70_11]